MSTTTDISPKRSKWLVWNPKAPSLLTTPGSVGFVGAVSEEAAEIHGTASCGTVGSVRILDNSLKSEPTKAVEPSSVGSVGGTPADNAEIGTQICPAGQAHRDPNVLRAPADSQQTGPTRPSKPSSVGIVGATSAESPEIGAGVSLTRDAPSVSNGESISRNRAETEPTKPPKPGCVGFVGASRGEHAKIRGDIDRMALARAAAVLNRTGVRIMQVDGEATIGIWSDLDGPEIREALRMLGSEQLPIRYLDGAGIPTRFKLRRVAGEPVPTTVLWEMERHPSEPWKVRDRMLQDLGWTTNAVSWAEWKVTSLNRLFLEQGVARRPGRLTAATVLHGESKRTTPRG